MTKQELQEQYDMAVAYGYVDDLRFKRAYARMKKQVYNSMAKQELQEQYDTAVAYGYVDDLRFKRAYARRKKQVYNYQ